MKTSPTEARRTVFGEYAYHIRSFKWEFFGILVTSALTVAVALSIPVLLRELVNTVATDVPDTKTIESLKSILLFIVVLWFAEWALSRISAICTMRLTIGVYANLYNSAFTYLLGHSHGFFASNFAGSLTHKVSKYAKAFEMLFDSIIGHFLPMGFFVAGAITIVWRHNVTLGVALLFWTLCFLVFQVYVSRLRQPIRVLRAQADSRMTGNLADAISNQAAITHFSGVPFEAKRFASTVRDWTKALTRTWHADLWIWSGIGLFMLVIQAIFIYGGVYYWQRGEFTPGDFVLMQAFLLSIFRSLEQLNREMRRMADAYSDASEMVSILSKPHEISDVSDAVDLRVSKGTIEFKRLAFRFHTERAMFENFDLTIAGGTKVALVGPSGAGKSTITKLLLRFFDVQKGAIEIDGQNIAQVTQESLRNAIAFVPQEPILFHRTLMENIRYGRRDATDDEVIAAARKAHCHEFISKLKDGYDTYVGERGIKLSGGERQRVAIARAILKNAPILILDEATSSLDSESEVLIQDALGQLMQGKTVLVIAHRLSTIMKMDRIIALDGGTIVEQGTHDELLKNNGIYARLWQHQAGGFIPSDDESVVG